MLTPQEVSEHAFAKASFGGYNMAMVDEFLDLLTEDYTTLYKENAALKAKMKVLVDKVEEYRSTEDAMRKALLTAQRMADDLVAEAEEKKRELLRGAEAEAKARVTQLAQEVRNEENRLAAVKGETADYVGKLKALYQHEMDYLNGLSGLTGGAAAPAAPAADKTAREIEAVMERVTAAAEETPAPAPEPEPVPIPAPEPAAPERRARPIPDPPPPDETDDPSPTRRIDFSHLQFGKDYEIR